MDEPYHDGHRAFLQAFMARSILTLDGSKPILAAIMTAQEGREILVGDITEADFNSYITMANNGMTALDLEIRSAVSQHDHTKIWVLVNSTSDAMTQLATTHTADEISYLRRVLDVMFDTNNNQRQELMAVKATQAINLNKFTAVGKGQSDNQNDGAPHDAGASLTVRQAEDMLHSLVAEGWFEKSKAGYYSLSARGLLELKSWLLETYNDSTQEDDDGEDEPQVNKIKLCGACKEIVTVGQRCPTRTCSLRLHDYCVQTFIRANRSRACPICKVEWTGNNYVGERAVIPNRTSDAQDRFRRDQA